MTKKETMMAEVLLTDKDIIEKLTKENDKLREQNRELQIQVNDLKTQLKAVTKCIGSIKDTPEFIQLEFERNELFQQLEEIKNNNKIENSDLYINLKKDYNIIYDKNQEMEKQIEDLNIKINKLSKNDINKDISFEDKTLNESKIQKALDSQKTIFDEKFNKYKKEQETKYNSLYNDFIELKNNVGIPTPSNSNEAKNSKIKKEIKKVPDFENLLNNNEKIFEIVYYRNINNNKYLPSYSIRNEIAYLECCGKQWDYKELNSIEGVTCLKCFKTYILNEDNKLKYNILQEHVIQDECHILNKIKCNNKICNYISKKEINLCYNCKNIENVKIIEYPMPDKNDEAYNTKISFAAKCHNSILYTAGIYDNAYKEGLVKKGWGPLINYIKTNKLVEEKQTNVIKNKIIRSYYIRKLYNEDKYKNIQDYVKRLNFSLNSIAKLKDDDFLSFQYDLTILLDKQIEKFNNDDKNKNIIEEDININNNKSDNIDIEKISKILDKNYLYKSNKDDKLCILENCNNKKHSFGKVILEYCLKHIKADFNL